MVVKAAQLRKADKRGSSMYKGAEVSVDIEWWEMVRNLVQSWYLKPHVARNKPKRAVRKRFLKGLTCPARKVNFIL